MIGRRVENRQSMIDFLRSINEQSFIEDRQTWTASNQSSLFHRLYFTEYSQFIETLIHDKMKDIDWYLNQFNVAENRKKLEESMVSVKYEKKNDPPCFVTYVEKMSCRTPMEQKRQTERIRRYFIGFIIFEKRVAWWDDASIRSRTTMLFDPDKARLKKTRWTFQPKRKEQKRSRCSLSLIACLLVRCISLYRTHCHSIRCSSNNCYSVSLIC